MVQVKVYEIEGKLHTFFMNTMGNGFLFYPIDGGKSVEIQGKTGFTRPEQLEGVTLVTELNAINKNAFNSDVALFDFQGKPYIKKVGFSLEKAEVGKRVQDGKIYVAGECGWEIDPNWKEEMRLYYTLLHAKGGEVVYSESIGMDKYGDSHVHKSGETVYPPDDGEIVAADPRLRKANDGYYYVTLGSSDGGITMYRHRIKDIHELVQRNESIWVPGYPV